MALRTATEDDCETPATANGCGGPRHLRWRKPAITRFLLASCYSSLLPGFLLAFCNFLLAFCWLCAISFLAFCWLLARFLLASRWLFACVLLTSCWLPARILLASLLASCLLLAGLLLASCWLVAGFLQASWWLSGSLLAGFLLSSSSLATGKTLATRKSQQEAGVEARTSEATHCVTPRNPPIEELSICKRVLSSEEFKGSGDQ